MPHSSNTYNESLGPYGVMQAALLCRPLLIYVLLKKKVLVLYCYIVKLNLACYLFE